MISTGIFLPWRVTCAATFGLLYLTAAQAAQFDDCEYTPNTPCEAALILITACAGQLQ